MAVRISVSSVPYGNSKWSAVGNETVPAVPPFDLRTVASIFYPTTRSPHVILKSIPSVRVRYTNARYFVSIFRPAQRDPMLVHASPILHILPGDSLSSMRSCPRKIGESSFPSPPLSFSLSLSLSSASIPRVKLNSIDVKFG